MLHDIDCPWQCLALLPRSDARWRDRRERLPGGRIGAMTMLQALDGYYHRLAARNLVTAPGWSAEKFGWCIVIDADGGPVDAYDLA
jgi:hypothetical protein